MMGNDITAIFQGCRSKINISNTLECCFPDGGISVLTNFLSLNFHFFSPFCMHNIVATCKHDAFLPLKTGMSVF